MSEKLNTQTIKVLTALIKFTLEQTDLVGKYAEKLNLAIDDDYPDTIDDFTSEASDLLFGTYPDLDDAKYRFPIANIAEKILIDAV